MREEHRDATLRLEMTHLAELGRVDRDAYARVKRVETANSTLQSKLQLIETANNKLHSEIQQLDKLVLELKQAKASCYGVRRRKARQEDKNRRQGWKLRFKRGEFARLRESVADGLRQVASLEAASIQKDGQTATLEAEKLKVAESLQKGDKIKDRYFTAVMKLLKQPKETAALKAVYLEKDGQVVTLRTEKLEAQEELAAAKVEILYKDSEIAHLYIVHETQRSNPCSSSSEHPKRRGDLVVKEQGT
ncbi:uncharacterized protein K452DRAFT_323205 [Aplosporella prunicola CBS 121167]|uniref:Uncharacterized protein n=1 Tax=Aplosporella prunicola CBS 121167 TaxID=1176127 RepID=A0A6A6AV94_9PEZI|nr:uncharacterized protein K452DRAFT_323205 [Aplosporella prunicola CBS 121167]KAF2135143.1 hypothetical protein K452DRAFT_323205 [Aplosporella prunicola CBS 121167]